MHNVRRYFKEGNTYFLTHVTFERLPILVDNCDLLWRAIDKYKDRQPLDVIAWAILPDHWHVLLDPKCNDVASLMKKIKLSFAQTYLKRKEMISGRVWHNRYWDHIIRDQQDLNRHVDYIHYNPVKHGLASSSAAYEHSSFSEFVSNGLYDCSWGRVDSVKIDGEFGE